LLEALAREFQRAAVLCHCADDLIGGTTRNFCVDLQCDFDGGVHQSSEMRNNLVSDAASVAAYAGWIKHYGGLRIGRRLVEIFVMRKPA
jgi:hypothetical protein